MEFSRSNQLVQHDELRTLTVCEYRQEQGVEPYDEMSKGWRVIILKKRREEINAKQREQVQKDMEKESDSPG